MHPNTRSALLRATAGVPRSAETRARISHAKKGVPVPPERRDRIRRTMLKRGVRPPAHSYALAAEAGRALVGPLRYNWKDEDAVGYGSLHDWVQRRRPRTGTCQRCGFVGYTENANLSGEYRRDLDDFQEMCVPCHKKHDAGVQLAHEVDSREHRATSRGNHRRRGAVV